MLEDKIGSIKEEATPIHSEDYSSLAPSLSPKS